MSGPPSEAPENARTPRNTTTDRYIGSRIRQRRVMLGLSQQQLAELIGVTYQQAQKYERGQNRVSAARLYELATALAVPIAWFFEGLAPLGEIASH